MCSFTAVDLKLCAACLSSPRLMTSSIYRAVTGRSSCSSWIPASVTPANFLPCCALLLPSCGVEMVTPWTSSEHANYQVHNDAMAINNKGTNIKHRDWRGRRPVLAEEALPLLKAYLTVFSWGLPGHTPSIMPPVFQSLGWDLTETGNTSGGQT